MESFEHIPMITQPQDITINLLPHQLASVYSMEKLEHEKTIRIGNTIVDTTLGINGDIPGYGKTLSMVTLILRDKMEWDVKEYHKTETQQSIANNLIVKRYPVFHEKINTTLILVNQPLIKQWVQEFSHTPLNIQTITTRRDADTIDASMHDVIIITPSMFNRFVERNYNMAWKRFIYDEPSNIKVPAMKKVVAGFTWFVTSTPCSLPLIHHKCNRSFMYHIALNWYNNAFVIKALVVKNNEDFIRQSWQMPPTHNHFYECFSPMYHTLNGLVNQRVFDMVDANNISGVISALGGNKTSNIIDLVRNKKLEEIEEINTKIRIYNIREDEEKIREWECRKNRVREQIEELNRRFDNLLNKDCSICFSKLVSPVMEPACQNIFCAKCLLKWLQSKTTCPLCRKNVPTDSLVYIEGEQKEEKQSKVLPTKEKAIIDIIKNRKDGRFIIFSSFNETFSYITSMLKVNDISFLEVKGSITTMNNRLEKFKKGDIQVIFLNSKHNGAGINLQEATDVIIYHKMSDDMIKQVLGRANRIGRTEPLHVHHLIYT